MIERKFIQQGIRNLGIEEYLKSELDKADFSHAEIKRTPLNTRITVYAARPGMVIGRGGQKIQELTETLKTKFGIDNPLLEVREIESPYLDANVVAKQIVAALERRVAHRRIINIMIQEVMNAGAVGVEVVVGGKLGGALARTERFSSGYLKKCGEPAVSCTDKAKAQANLKQGVIGVKVTIMKSTPDILALAQKLNEIKKQAKEKKNKESIISETGEKEEKLELEVAEDAKKPKKSKGKKKESDAETKEAPTDTETKTEEKSE